MSDTKKPAKWRDNNGMHVLDFGIGCPLSFEDKPDTIYFHDSVFGRFPPEVRTVDESKRWLLATAITRCEEILSLLRAVEAAQ